MFVELDRCQNADYTVSLEWNRDTGKTQIVVVDSADASALMLAVPGASVADSPSVQILAVTADARGAVALADSPAAGA